MDKDNQSSPDSVEAAMQECVDIAMQYDDCGGEFIAQKIRDRILSLQPASDEAAAALDREAVSKVVKHLLYNDDRERDYPVYRTQDDNGLEESEYVDFAMDVLAARTLNAAQPSSVSSEQMAVTTELFFGLTSFMEDDK